MNAERDIAVANENCNLAVLSDLHICEGYDQHRAAYSPSEHFFSDEAFGGLLRQLHRNNASSGRSLKLIINGDFIDFVRARSVPDDKERQLFTRYFRRLRLLTHEENFEIHPQENRFGLRTDEYKSVWKLYRISRGHPVIFEALAEFLALGNRLVIIKGNHDLEFFWPAVQAEFIKLLAAKIKKFLPDRRAFLERCDLIRASVEFCQRAYIIENQLYIEHGHQYEKMTRAERELARNDRELHLPPGSVLNRYMINAIEHLAPLVTRVGGNGKIVRTFIAMHRWRALRLLMRHFPIATRMLLRGHKRVALYLFMEFLPYLMALGYAGFAIVLPALWQAYADWISHHTGPFGLLITERLSLNLLLCFGLFGSIRQLLRLLAPDLKFKFQDAVNKAKGRTRQVQAQMRKFIVLGHTHKPEVLRLEDNWWYVNTGSWVPLAVRNQGPELEQHAALTFASFVRNANGNFDFGLHVWREHLGKSEILPSDFQ